MQSAFLRSTLIRMVAEPEAEMRWTASSTDAYRNEHHCISTPSLTLCPLGYDISTITLHYPVPMPLGTRPTRLQWTACCARVAIGPTILTEMTCLLIANKGCLTRDDFGRSSVNGLVGLCIQCETHPRACAGQNLRIPGQGGLAKIKPVVGY